MTAIEFENISKQYRLGLVSTGTLSHDLNGIKKMAKAAGMPYQTLINSIIHRYVTGGIVFKVAV